TKEAPYRHQTVKSLCSLFVIYHNEKS
ncbi:MAG: hypothetical protein JWN84_817, partial [Nocardioides sp.]|nr:hypothetical protein [Nocardioides sp.]